MFRLYALPAQMNSDPKNPRGGMRKAFAMSGILDLLQISGGIILCAGYVPQIRRIIATRSAHDLSLTMWLSFLTGLGMMEIYALNIFLTAGSRALLITNSASLAFSIAMVWLIIAYGTRPAWATVTLLRHDRALRIHPAAHRAELEQAA